MALTLMAVHAHPDDECSSTGGVLAKYAAEGVRTIVVTCTNGELGDGPGGIKPGDPGHDTEAVAATRRGALRNAGERLGVTTVELLGYHDSGMPDTEVNQRPDNFANAPLDEAVGRLVAIIRAERPQVIVTYADDRKFYPHPDHIRVHEISGPAFDAAGDATRYPEAGPPWQPSKMYYTGFSRRRVQAMHDAFIQRGEESPYARWFENDFPDQDHRFTTFVDVGDFLHHRRAALLAHRTQVDPDGHWMRLPDDVIRSIFPWDEYALARSTLGELADGVVEDDLFEGVRASERATVD